MESIFFHDSMMCMSLIRAVEEEGHEELRWLAGFYAANSFLDAFGLSLEEKKKYAEYMSGQFAKEFGASKEHTVILDGKFRTYRNRLFSFAGNGPGSVLERRLKEIVAERDRAILPLIGMISAKEGYHKTAYVDSLIHMSVNRLFRSKQRIYECVIYNLLKKYYTSVLAQQPVLV
jgi:thiopeptide-type bacteriocin biosynthesis protein